MIKLGDTGVSKLYVGSTAISRAYIGNELVFHGKKSRLPAGYTEVEYIENSDTSSYINTQKYINNSDFIIQVQSPKYEQAPYGNLYLFYTANFSLYANVYKKLYLLSKPGSQTAQNYDIGAMTSNKIIVEGTGKSVSVNSVDVTLSSNNYGGNFIFPYNLSSSSQIIRIYSFKAKNSTYPTHENFNFDLIPCINPGGIAGLYDLTNSKFIGPTAGTFIAGPEV